MAQCTQLSSVCPVLKSCTGSHMLIGLHAAHFIIIILVSSHNFGIFGPQ